MRDIGYGLAFLLTAILISIGSAWSQQDVLAELASLAQGLRRQSEAVAAQQAHLERLLGQIAALWNQTMTREQAAHLAHRVEWAVQNATNRVEWAVQSCDPEATSRYDILKRLHAVEAQQNAEERH